MGVLLFAAGSSRCVVVVVDRDERMREKQWRRKDFGSCFCPYKIGEDGEEGGGVEIEVEVVVMARVRNRESIQC